MNKRELDAFKEAYGEGFQFIDENVLMLSWYSQRIIQKMRADNCRSCMSLGIGHKIVSKKIISDLAPSLKKYLIVEGSKEFINELQHDVKLPQQVSIIHSLFEDFDPGVKLDAIEMGFVLEHVADPSVILKRYAKFLKPEGCIFIAVPNARSLHRLVGQRAGLMDDLFALSEFDIRLGHRRYFDLETVNKLIIESGLKIFTTEGIFLKPFSTSQLKSLNLVPEVINSLCSIASDLPEISNAIYIEAVL
ncbi:MAG: methyltransferase domain-containing protein [Nitrospiraceae bacterium]|nr:MAG: methyltransferase domain-containing protein [Nitrospiraceae bacterium]